MSCTVHQTTCDCMLCLLCLSFLPASFLCLPRNELAKDSKKPVSMTFDLFCVLAVKAEKSNAAAAATPLLATHVLPLTFSSFRQAEKGAGHRGWVCLEGRQKKAGSLSTSPAWPNKIVSAKLGIKKYSLLRPILQRSWPKIYLSKLFLVLSRSLPIDHYAIRVEAFTPSFVLLLKVFGESCRK